MALHAVPAVSVVPAGAQRKADRRTEASDLRLELTARAAEERQVIDLNRERVRRALTYIEGGRRMPAWQEVAAIGSSLDRRLRQLDGGDAA